MKKVIFSMAVLGMTFLVSCGGGDTDTLTASDAQDATEASHDAETFAVDTNTSSTTWRGFKFYEDTSKPEEGHYGIVKMKNGELMFKEGVLEAGKLVADQTTFESVDYAEDQENKAKLEGHLKSPDFLNVEQFPEAVFEISSVKALEEGDYNTEISGNLDFRGTPKNITFKANVKQDGDQVTIQSEELKINRQDFGIDFAPGGGTIIKDEVILQLDVKANKA